MNQTVKFGKQRLKRCYASVVCTYAIDPLKHKRPVRRAGVVDVKSSERLR
jgi:hypothetical protein